MAVVSLYGLLSLLFQNKITCVCKSFILWIAILRLEFKSLERQFVNMIEYWENGELLNIFFLSAGLLIRVTWATS